MTDDSNEAITYGSVSIKQMGNDDRPREKALRDGVRSLSDAELIGIILGGGVPGASVLDIARRILADCNHSTGMLSRVGIRDLMKKYKGVGPAKAVCLAAAFELGKRAYESISLDSLPRIRGSEDVVRLMRPILGTIDHEEFWVLMLNRAGLVKEKRLISRGGMAGTVVDVKIILKQAIDDLAASIILCHNHPSGNGNPSREDDGVTNKVREAARMLDIQVLDHIIIAADTHFSYADSGRL